MKNYDQRNLWLYNNRNNMTFAELAKMENMSESQVRMIVKQEQSKHALLDSDSLYREIFNHCCDSRTANSIYHAVRRAGIDSIEKLKSCERPFSSIRCIGIKAAALLEQVASNC